MNEVVTNDQKYIAGSSQSLKLTDCTKIGTDLPQSEVTRPSNRFRICIYFSS